MHHHRKAPPKIQNSSPCDAQFTARLFAFVRPVQRSVFKRFVGFAETSQSRNHNCQLKSQTHRECIFRSINCASCKFDGPLTALMADFLCLLVLCHWRNHQKSFQLMSLGADCESRKIKMKKERKQKLSRQLHVEVILMGLANGNLEQCDNPDESCTNWDFCTV